MKLAILSTALLKEVDVGTAAERPEYRKATRKMRNCHSVSELCLKRLPEDLLASLKKVGFENTCTVLGTSLGEIEITRDFLVTLDQSGMARPILFQNSLHNAVNGFITMALGLRGPSITVSNRFMTSENSIQAAQLLMGEIHPFALIVCGEIIVEDFMPSYTKNYPKGTQLHDGAGAIFVATEEAVKDFDLKPLAWINEVRIGGQGLFTDREHYDSNGLEKIISFLTETPLGDSREIRLTKPDGSVSTILL